MAKDKKSSKKGRRPMFHPGENVGATAPKATHRMFRLAPHIIEGQVFLGKEVDLLYFTETWNNSGSDVTLCGYDFAARAFAERRAGGVDVFLKRYLPFSEELRRQQDRSPFLVFQHAPAPAAPPRAYILQLFGNVGNLRAVRKSRGISTQAIVITGIAAILFLSFIVLSVYGIYRTRASREWYECYTPECRLAADYVKEHITEDIDPCQDFYGYVCNTWAHRRASTLSFLEDVKDAFWSHLNRTLLSVTNPQPVDAGGRHLMFPLYSKCFAFMTTTKSVHESVEHVIAVTEVRRLMQRNTFRDLFVQMIHLSLVRGVTTLFELAFRRDKDIFLHVLKGTSLRFKASPVSNHRTYDDYLGEVIQDKEIEGIFSRQSRTETGPFYILGSLHDSTPENVWMDSINKNLVSDSYKQTVDKEIFVTGLAEIKKVIDLLTRNSETAMHMATYLAVHVAIDLLRYDYFRRYEQQHTRDVVALCLNTTRRFLYYSWAYLVANLTVNWTALENSDTLYNDILHGVAEHMNLTEWMELPSRLEAVRKVRRIQLVQPKTVLPATLKSIVNYTYVANAKHDFVATYMETAQVAATLRRDLVGQDRQGEYGKLQLAGDVMYLEERGELFMPAIMMHEPVFYPKGVGEPFNYGTLDALVAKVLSEAIGPAGAARRADKIEALWWTDQTAAAYAESVRCFDEQYSHLENTTLPMAKELRDDAFIWIRSVRIAFDRYRMKYHARTLRSRERRQHDQAFFIRFCLLTCSTHEEAKQLLPRLRCHLAVANIHQFLPAFQCRGPTKLNMDKCPFI
ncbi:neprilysin-1-like [Haemaphysalis longicornis]